MSNNDQARNLNSVAREANVSAMTVSRVLRNNPHVSAATRMKVLSAVKRLNYTPDPHVARLMQRVRNYRQSQAEAVIGLVRDDTFGDELLDTAYHYLPLDNVITRAEQHGYRVTEFRLNRKTMTARRLENILETRGIEGLIISPQSTDSIGLFPICGGHRRLRTTGARLASRQHQHDAWHPTGHRRAGGARLPEIGSGRHAMGRCAFTTHLCRRHA